MCVRSGTTQYICNRESDYTLNVEGSDWTTRVTESDIQNEDNKIIFQWEIVIY